MKPGDFFVIRTDGWAAPWIRLITRSDVNHAGLYVGNGTIIEARPEGAGYAPVSDGAIWSHLPLTDAERVTVVQQATLLVGTPYSWVDVACIGLADLFGWHVPEWVRKRLNRRDRLMCSQLVDEAYRRAGIQLFTDGRPSGDVSPGDLADLLVAQTDSLSEP